MNERIEEQARAAALAAAAQQKNNETQAEVEKLKEQLTIQAAERESNKEKIQHLEQRRTKTRVFFNTGTTQTSTDTGNTTS